MSSVTSINSGIISSCGLGNITILSGFYSGGYTLSSGLPWNSVVSWQYMWKEPYNQELFMVEYLQDYFNRFHVTADFSEFVLYNNLLGVYNYEDLVTLYKVQREEGNHILSVSFYNMYKYFSPTMDFSKVAY